jgi:transposase
MERYIGLDVHKDSTTAVAVTSAGRRLWSRVTETNAEQLIELVKSEARPRFVVMEEGACSEWLYEVLSPHADSVVVVMPEKRDSTKPKSDEKDALELAESARTGRVRRSVFKDVGKMTELREAVRTYQLLTQDLTRTANRLHAAFRARGLRGSSEALDPAKREAALAQLPEKYRWRSTQLALEHEKIEELQKTAHDRLLLESKRHPVVKLLATIPGIGPIRSATIVAVVVTPNRFRTKRQFWSYCGLAIVTVVSAQWKRKDGVLIPHNVALPRGLNRNRNPWLKEVFKGAAHLVTTRLPDHPLHQDYLRMVSAGTEEALAQLTIARRLAAACLAMWKHEEEYDPTKHRSRHTA